MARRRNTNKKRSIKRKSYKSKVSRKRYTKRSRRRVKKNMKGGVGWGGGVRNRNLQKGGGKKTLQGGWGH